MVFVNLQDLMNNWCRSTSLSSSSEAKESGCGPKVRAGPGAGSMIPDQYHRLSVTSTPPEANCYLRLAIGSLSRQQPDCCVMKGRERKSRGETGLAADIIGHRNYGGS